MIEAIRLLKSRFPDTRLIVNRGFEILPQIKDLVDSRSGRVAVPVVEQHVKPLRCRERKRPLLADGPTRPGTRHVQAAGHRDRLRPARQTHSGTRNRHQNPGERLHSLGQRWSLNGMGMGALEILPRKILMLYDEKPDGDVLKESQLHRYAAMPLNYLGYVPEYRNLQTEGLPDASLAGRYAGIVTWFTSTETSNGPALAKWLLQQVRGWRTDRHPGLLRL